MKPARIGIVGLGMMGRAHLGALLRTPNARAMSVADPSPEAKRHADAVGVVHFADYRHMVENAELDGVLIATPNADHHPVGMAFIERGIPVLIEKPIAETYEAAESLCKAAEAHEIPILVGHHRRHNPAVQLVRSAVGKGLIGQPTVATILDLKLKPQSYFTHAWRSEPAAGGPILLNMIHEIDLLRFIFGDIVSLQAFTSNAARGLGVEDTAAVMLRFKNGALGTILVSDAAATPYSWDLASGEFDLITGMTGEMNRQKVASHIFGGTLGSVTLPDAEFHSYQGPGEAGWRSDLTTDLLGAAREDTYLAQMTHFADVAMRKVEPLSSGLDASKTLRATLAVKESAATGAPVYF